MKQHQKYMIGIGIVFVLFIISYKYSLLHDVSQLPYLHTPETMPPFTRLITYLFMIIGMLPTILMILFTAIFCRTSYPAGVVIYQCFGSPFALQDGTGFIAYVIASIISIWSLYYITRPQK